MAKQKQTEQTQQVLSHARFIKEGVIRRGDSSSNALEAALDEAGRFDSADKDSIYIDSCPKQKLVDALLCQLAAFIPNLKYVLNPEFEGARHVLQRQSKQVLLDMFFLGLEAKLENHELYALTAKEVLVELYMEYFALEVAYYDFIHNQVVFGLKEIFNVTASMLATGGTPEAFDSHISILALYDELALQGFYELCCERGLLYDAICDITDGSYLVDEGLKLLLKDETYAKTQTKIGRYIQKRMAELKGGER